MKKRVVSFILTAFLLLTLCSTPVFAEPAPTYGLGAKTVTVGDEFTMTVSIANNPGIISLRFTVEYDSEKLQLLEASDAELLKGFTTPSPTISSPFTLRWADNLATTNNTANGNIVALKFKALAVTDATAVSINHAEARNATGKKVTFENVSVNVKVNAKQIACNHGNAENVNGKAATCTDSGLKAYWHCPNCGKNYSDSACTNEITEDLAIWRTINKLGHDYVAVVTLPTSTMRGYTTHTCSRCHDSYVDTYTDPVGEYTPGDVDGKNGINAVDYMLTKAYVLKTLTNVTEDQKQAMDVYQDGKIDARDYFLIKIHVLGTYVIK